MAVFPTSAATDADLFVAVNNKSTTLNGAINDVTTTVVLTSASGFPTSGYVTIDAEAIKYTGVSTNTLTGVTRGADGTTAASHIDGALVQHTIVANHHNASKDEIKAIESNIGTRFGFGSTNVVIASGDLAVDTNTLYVDSANNRVGILTASPTQDLDITSSKNGTVFEMIKNTNATVGQNRLARISLLGNNAVEEITMLAGRDSSNVSYETIGVGTKLDLQVGGASKVQITTTGLDVVSTSGNVLTVDTNVLVVDATNNRIGVNNASPAVALDVTGTVAVSSTGSFGGAVTITPTSNQVVLGTTRTVTITAPTPATTSRTWTIPDISSDGTFVALEGTQTLSGAKTFSSAITINPATNQIVLGSTNTVTLNAAAPAASRTWTLPDLSTNPTFAALEATQTFTGSKTLSAAAGNPIHGTNTNDSASAGYIGETTSSTGSAVTLTTAVYNDVTSISLTAGDWDVGVNLAFTGGTITGTIVYGGIGTTSGNSGAGLVVGTNAAQLPTVPTANSDVSLTVSPTRISLAGTTTYYLKAYSVFTVGTVQAYGTIFARRVR